MLWLVWLCGWRLGKGVGFDSGEAVGGAFDAGSGVFEDVSVDHGCSEVRVTQEFLNRSDICSSLQ